MHTCTAKKVDLYCYGLETLYSELKEYDKAVQSYDTALYYDPNNPDAWDREGLALGNSGKHVQALECYNIALELDPGNGTMGLCNLKSKFCRTASPATLTKSYDNIENFDRFTSAQVETNSLRGNILQFGKNKS